MSKKRLKGAEQEIVLGNANFKHLKISNPYQLTEKQKTILQAALDARNKCVMIDGLYGTGKSFLAILAALQLLKNGDVEKIVYLRNAVESSSIAKLGYLPGDISEKISPYMQILKEKMLEVLPIPEYKFLEKEEAISTASLSFIRGLTYKNSVVILDEAACVTMDDLILLSTRLGEGSRLFIIGDSENQSDIGSKSGFKKFYNLFNNQEAEDFGIKCFELKSEEDIKRSDFVKFVLKKVGVLKIK